MKTYGMPYVGSKSRIAKWMIEQLPASPVLLDVFAGGCAITHSALESGKFECIIANDINTQFPQLFFDAVSGKYRNETRWIDCETFHAEKMRDAFVACCWSFGNNLYAYAYSKHIEPYKKAVHYAVVFDDWAQFTELCHEVSDVAKKSLNGIKNTHDRRIGFQRSVVSELRRLTGDNYEHSIIQNNAFYRSCKCKRLQSLQSLQSLESLESLERLERLQSLESLQSLQNLQNLQLSTLSFEQLDIPACAVVYCDPPYAGTLKGQNAYFGTYKTFDKTRFLDWCVDVSKTNRVFVSEYSIKDPRFVVVAQKEKICSICSTVTQKVVEKLYTVKT